MSSRHKAKPRGRNPRGFLFGLIVAIFSIQPLAYVVGYYTCHDTLFSILLPALFAADRASFDCTAMTDPDTFSTLDAFSVSYGMNIHLTEPFAGTAMVAFLLLHNHSRKRKAVEQGIKCS